MDKKLKEKWVKALRGGRYKQGRYLLEWSDGGNKEHCCLGVLCRVAKLPLEYNTIGDLMSDDDQSKFITMNDNEKKNFRQIASYIEKRKAI